MTSSTGVAFVEIRPDLTGFNTSLDSGLRSALKGAGTKVGTDLGDDLTSGVKKSTSGLPSLFQSIGDSASTFGTRVKSSITDFIGPAAVATGAVAGVAGAIIGTVSAASSFQRELSGIKAVSGATAIQMDLISAAAKRIGADTVFSSSQAAAAMQELIKAGVSVDDVLGGAADAAVNLASAGGIQLPEAATIAANALNQFNLQGKDMAHVADLIAGAANASAIDVSQFGFSLQQVGAVARTIGLSFDDTTAAIAALGQAGIVGSDAGTSLKTMFLNLQPTTKQAAGLFKELGIITKDGANQFFDATGKVKSLADISQVLQNALQGQTDAQKTANLQILFGTDAVRAAAVLSRDGAAGINEMATAMKGISAADVAKTKLDNFSGTINALKGSAETLAITLGTPVINALNQVGKAATVAINAINAALTGGVIATGAGQVIAIFEKIGQEINRFRVPLIAVAGIVSALLIPALVTAGVAALVSASQTGVLFALYRIEAAQSAAAWVAARTSMVASWALLQVQAYANAAKIAGAWIASTAQAIAAQAAYATASAVNAARASAAWIAHAAVATVQAIRAGAAWLFVSGPGAAAALATMASTFARMAVMWVRAAAQALVQAARMAVAWTIALGPLGIAVAAATVLIGGLVIVITRHWDEIKKATAEAWRSVQETIGPVLSWISSTATEAFEGLQHAWDVVWASLKQFAAEIEPLLVGAWANIQAAVRVAGAVITAVLSGVVAAMQLTATAIETILPAIAAVVAGAFDVVRTVVLTTIGIIQNAWHAWGDDLVAAATAAFTIVQTVISTAVAVIAGVIRLALALISGDWSAAWAAVGGIATSAWAGISKTIAAALTVITTAVGLALSVVVGVVMGSFATITAIVTTTMQILGGLVGTALGGVVNAVRSAMTTVVALLHAGWDTTTIVTRQSLDGLRQIIGIALDAVIDFFRNLPGRIVAALGNIGNLLVDAGNRVVGGLIDGVRSRLQDAINAVLNVKDGIFRALGDTGRWLLDAGNRIIGGLIDGIKSRIGDAVGLVASVGDKIKGAFSAALHIGSPSKDFRQFGVWIGEGLIDGVESMTAAAQNAAANLLRVPSVGAAALTTAQAGPVPALNQAQTVKNYNLTVQSNYESSADPVTWFRRMERLAGV